MRIESSSYSSTPAADTTDWDTPPPASDPPVLHTEFLVLSAAAYTAKTQAPRAAAMLAGSFSVTLGGATASLQVTPGADGMVHVQLVLKSVPQWPEASGPFHVVHLEADLRQSWVERVSDGARSPAEAAGQLASAVVELAQLPAQTTVTVLLEPEMGGSAGGALAA